MSRESMQSIKAEAKRHYSHISGVKGFGVGQNSLRVYVVSRDAASQIPQIFRGVRVDVVEVGDIVACSHWGCNVR